MNKINTVDAIFGLSKKLLPAHFNGYLNECLRERHYGSPSGKN